MEKNTRSVTESSVLDALAAHAKELAPLFEHAGLDAAAAAAKLQRMADVRRKQAAGQSPAARFNRAAAVKLTDAMDKDGAMTISCSYVMEHVADVLNGAKAVAIMREAAAQGLVTLTKATEDGPTWRAGALLAHRVH